MKRSLNQQGRLLAAALSLAFAGWGVATQAAPGAHSGNSTATQGKAGPPAAKVSRDQVNKGVTKSHGKTKSRGVGDIFHVDNHTDYSIDIYVDGHYKGTVSGLGDLYFPDSTGGVYTVEGYAPGTDYHWGPKAFTTPFTWKLYD